VSLTEIIAVIFSLLATVLAIRRRFHTWTLGLVGIGAYAVLFWQQHLWANLCLQGVFVGQSLHGMWVWRRPHVVSGAPQRVRWGWLATLCVGGIGVLWWLFAGGILSISGWNPKNPQPFVDSFTTVLSIVGYYLLAVRRSENWVCWGVVDAVYVYLFAEQGLWLSAVLYALFCGLAVWGVLAWKTPQSIDFGPKPKPTT